MSANGVPPRTNVPVIALCSAVLLVIVVIVALSFAPADRTGTPAFVTVIGVVVSSVPALIAAAFAERVSKDVRNGTLVQKVKQGTTETLREAGVVTHDDRFSQTSVEPTGDDSETEGKHNER